MVSISSSVRVSKLHVLHKIACAFTISFLSTSAPAVSLPPIPAQPVLTISPAGDRVAVLDWAGGTAPFQVQMCTNLAGPWEDVGDLTTNASQTNIATSSSAFYRVGSATDTYKARRDKTAPTVPTGLTAQAVSSSRIDLRWSASSDASGIKGYNVYRNNVFLAQVAAPTTSASDTGLKPSTTYTYKVSAVDTAMNSSAQSSPVSATTLGDGSCTYAITPTGATVAAGGGTGMISVTASSGSCAWTATSGVAWIAITGGASGTGSGAVSYSVDANTSTSQRSGTLTVAGQTFTVTQGGQTVTGPANDYFANATLISGQTVSVTGSNTGATRESGEPVILGISGGASVWWSWTSPFSGSVTISLAGSSFDTILGVYTGSSVSTLTLVAANDDASGVQSAVTFNAVSGTTYKIAVDGFNGTTGSIALSVSMAATCTYSLSPTTASVSYGAGSGNLSVTAGTGCAWTASSSAAWLTIASGASGTGSGSISYSVAANPDTASRAAIITVAGQTFTLTQSGAPCTYAISPSSVSVAATASTGSLNVSAGTSCYWTATSSAGWISITSGASGSGSGTVSYSVAANTGTSARTGTLTVAGQTFTVMQAGTQVADTTPPTVSLTSPANGSTVSGTITPTASASDNVGVTRVEFYVDSTLVGSVSAAPYSANWDTTTLANGTYLILAKAYDAAGNSGTSSASVSINNTTILPGGGVLQWVKQMYSGAQALPASVTSDHASAPIVAGSFITAINLGGGSLASAGSLDGFIAKYSQQGGLAWAKRFGNTADDRAYAVAVDSQNNIFVTGYFEKNVDFGGTTLMANDPYQLGQPDIFVVKYSPSGALLWAKRFGGTSYDVGWSLAVDASDNVVIAANFTGSVDFGGVALTSSGGTSDIALLKLSGSSGSTLWVKGLASSGYDSPNGVALDRSGDIFLAGTAGGAIDFGGGLTTGGVFLAKYSGADGSYRWNKLFPCSIAAVASDPATGNVFITGGFTGSVDFGGGAITTILGQNGGIFVAGYGPSGSYLWARAFGAAGDSGAAITVDSDRNVTFTGAAAGLINFTGTGNAMTGNGYIVLSLSSAGTDRWGQRGGDSYGNGIATDYAGHVFVTGSIQGVVDFGGTSLSNTSMKDGFVAQYSK